MYLILTEVNRTQGTTGSARLNQNIGPSRSASCLSAGNQKHMTARWRNPAAVRQSASFPHTRCHFDLPKWELTRGGLISLPNIQSSLHNFNSLVICPRKTWRGGLQEVNQFSFYPSSPREIKSQLLHWAQTSHERIKIKMKFPCIILEFATFKSKWTSPWFRCKHKHKCFSELKPQTSVGKIPSAGLQNLCL